MSVSGHFYFLTYPFTISRVLRSAKPRASATARKLNFNLEPFIKSSHPWISAVAITSSTSITLITAITVVTSILLLLAL